jgi:hypothetical protein
MSAENILGTIYFELNDLKRNNFWEINKLCTHFHNH